MPAIPYDPSCKGVQQEETTEPDQIQTAADIGTEGQGPFGRSNPRPRR
jgi:hypothetical protein